MSVCALRTPQPSDLTQSSRYPTLPSLVPAPKSQGSGTGLWRNEHPGSWRARAGVMHSVGSGSGRLLLALGRLRGRACVGLCNGAGPEAGSWAVSLRDGSRRVLPFTIPPSPCFSVRLSSFLAVFLSWHTTLSGLSMPFPSPPCTTLTKPAKTSPPRLSWWLAPLPSAAFTPYLPRNFLRSPQAWEDQDTSCPQACLRPHTQGPSQNLREGARAEERRGEERGLSDRQGAKPPAEAADLILGDLGNDLWMPEHSMQRVTPRLMLAHSGAGSRQSQHWALPSTLCTWAATCPTVLGSFPLAVPPLPGAEAEPRVRCPELWRRGKERVVRGLG